MALSVISLFSGSTGNCTYVTAGNGEGILIDAGVSASAVERGLASVGADIRSVRAIFVTHEHCDHVRGLAVLSKKHRIPIHITALSAENCRFSPETEACAAVHPTLYRERTAGITVESFAVPHDSRCCVGYRVTEEATGDSAAIATDIGSLNREILGHFLGCRGVMLECNHDIPMLLSNPTYPETLKERILSEHGHLSNELCGKCVRWLSEQGVSRFLLAHVSRDNNTPELARKAVAAIAGEGVEIAVALPDTPVKLM